MKYHSQAIALAACLLIPIFTSGPARAQSVVIGFNVPYLNNPDRKSSRTDQEIATLKDLEAAGVHVIRTGIAADKTGLDLPGPPVGAHAGPSSNIAPHFLTGA